MRYSCNWINTRHKRARNNSSKWKTFGCMSERKLTYRFHECVHCLKIILHTNFIARNSKNAKFDTAKFKMKIFHREQNYWSEHDKLAYPLQTSTSKSTTPWHFSEGISEKLPEFYSAILFQDDVSDTKKNQKSNIQKGKTRTTPASKWIPAEYGSIGFSLRCY